MMICCGPRESGGCALLAPGCNLVAPVPGGFATGAFAGLEGAENQELQRQQGHQGRTLPARQRTLTRHGDVPGRLRRS